MTTPKETRKLNFFCCKQGRLAKSRFWTSL